MDSFAGRRVTVMGLGTFGAQIAAVRFLSQAGAQVTVTDLRPEAELSSSLEQLAALRGVQFHLGGHNDEDFVSTDLVVVSPAVRPGSRYLCLARQAGVRITSEIRLFWERCRAPIVGVTGTNGKSTTTTLIHDILEGDGRRVWLGGNIGQSLLNQVDAIDAGDWVVLELSSFQLADLDVDRRSPHIAVVTNIAPNHLDWHGSHDAYVEAKQSILRWQMPEDLVIRRREGSEAHWPATGRALFCGSRDTHDCLVTLDESDHRLCLVSSGESIDLAKCPGLHGRHLQTAALLAATTGVALDVNVKSIRTALQRFSGLPHRLQPVGTWKGRSLINDSASTTPESTIAALESFERPVVLIVGGAEKGCGLDELAAAIVHRARATIVLGDVGETLVREIESRRCGPPGSSGVLEFLTRKESLAAAVQTAGAYSQTGDAIVFSPGFASGSMFLNFDARGREFIRLVESL